jgi:hypothetical protein
MALASERMSGDADSMIATSASERKHRMGIEDWGIENPDPDVAEQRRAIDPDEDDNADSSQPPLEADPADFADQHRAIPLSDDDR